MQKLFLGSLVKGDHICAKSFHQDHHKYAQVCKFEESKEWTVEERECHLLRHEYKMCVEGNPEMGSTFIGSRIVLENGKKVVKHPTKQEYLELLI